MTMKTTALHLGEEVSGTVRHVADLGRTVGERLDEVRCGTADALGGAASSVRSTGRQGSEVIDNLAESAAAQLDSTAKYVRNHDIGEMLLGDLRLVVRRHPTSFVVGAVAFGFFLASAIRRKAS